MLRPKPSPETRPSLLGALKGSNAGDADWRRFFEAYAPSVFRVARKHGLTVPDADDVVQQVMVAVSAHISRFDPDSNRCRFRHWIRVITTNKVTDTFRRHAARPTEQIGDCDKIAGPEVNQLWNDEWYLQDLQACLRTIAYEISPKRFEAFQLYVLKGVSAAETARRLNMTANHVYVTRSMVIRRLRQLFDQLHNGDADA